MTPDEGPDPEPTDPNAPPAPDVPPPFEPPEGEPLTLEWLHEQVKKLLETGRMAYEHLDARLAKLEGTSVPPSPPSAASNQPEAVLEVTTEPASDSSGWVRRA